MNEHKEEEREDGKEEVNSDALEAAFTEHEFGNEEEDDHAHPKAIHVEEDDPSPEWHSMDDQDSW